MSRQPHASITERFTWQPRSVFALGLSAEELGVFCYLSNMATFKDLDLTTRAGKIKLLPGQLYSTIRQLGEQLKITKDKVARVLKKLAEMGLVTLLKTATKAATHGTIVSVCHLTKFPPDGFNAETMSETKTRQECDTNRKRETGEKKDSPYSPPEGDEDPMAGLEPQPQRAAGAGPSKPASGAGCTNPDPQPSESQQAAPDGAGPPKNSAQKVPVRSAEFMAAWNAMPKMARKRSSLDLAEREWKKLKPHEREDVLRAIPIWEDNEYAKGAHRWLRDKLFQGLLDAEGGVSKPRAPSYRDAYRNAEEDCPA